MQIPSELMTLIGYIMGFLSAIFAEPLRTYLFRPKLKVEYLKSDEDSAFLFKTPDFKDGLDFDSIWVRVKVKNTKRTNATGCQVFLSKIEKMDEQDCFQVIHYDALPLTWAYQHSNCIDIPPGIDMYADVAYFTYKSGSFGISTPREPEKWKNFFHPPLTIKVHLLVISNNAPIEKLILKIEWTGGTSINADKM